MDLQKTYDAVKDKGTLGTAIGAAGGLAALSQLLKSWGSSEAAYAARKGIGKRMHPALAAGLGASLALLGRVAYDKYKDYQQRNYLY